MVCVNREVVGVIELQDIIKPGIQERFERNTSGAMQDAATDDAIHVYESSAIQRFVNGQMVGKRKKRRNAYKHRGRTRPNACNYTSRSGAYVPIIK